MTWETAQALVLMLFAGFTMAYTPVTTRTHDASSSVIVIANAMETASCHI